MTDLLQGLIVSISQPPSIKGSPSLKVADGESDSELNIDDIQSSLLFDLN